MLIVKCSHGRGLDILTDVRRKQKYFVRVSRAMRIKK